MKFIALFALFSVAFAAEITLEDTDRGLAEDGLKMLLSAAQPFLDQNKANFEKTLNDMKENLQKMADGFLDGIAKNLPLGKQFAENVKKAADEFQNFVKTMGEKPSVAIQQMNDKFDEAAKAIEDFKIDAPNDFAKNALNVLSPVIAGAKAFLKSKVNELKFHANDVANVLGPQWANAIQATANQGSKLSDALTNEMDKWNTDGQATIASAKAAASDNINELDSVLRREGGKLFGRS